MKSQHVPRLLGLRGQWLCLTAGTWRAVPDSASFQLLQKCTLLAHHMGHDQKQDVEDGTAVRRPGVSKLRLVSPYRRNLAPGAELGAKTRPSDWFFFWLWKRSGRNSFQSSSGAILGRNNCFLCCFTPLHACLCWRRPIRPRGIHAFLYDVRDHGVGSGVGLQWRCDVM